MLIRRLRSAAAGWAEDQAAQMGAALAYYTLFSLTPLLVLTITVVGSFLGEEESRQHVLTQIRHFIDDDTAQAVGVMLEQFNAIHANLGTSTIGLASLFFGATGMFNSLRSSLQRIWRLKPVQKGIVHGFLETYLVAFLMVLVVCIFMITLLFTSTLVPFFDDLWVGLFPGTPWVGRVVYYGLTIFLLMLLLGFTFRFLSDGRLRYSQVWTGAFVSAILFTLGKLAIGYYLAYANLASAFGAAGSVVVFLAWVYYSAQILFFGAEVIRAGLPTPP